MNFQNYITLLLTVLLSFKMAACSGLAPSPFVTTTSPSELSRLEGGGSLSTLWYHGSDEKYHYFRHLVKTTTRYKIPRSQLNWEEEFPLNSKKDILVTNQLSRAAKLTNGEQGSAHQSTTAL